MLVDAFKCLSLPRLCIWIEIRTSAWLQVNETEVVHSSEFNVEMRNVDQFVRFVLVETPAIRMCCQLPSTSAPATGRALESLSLWMHVAHRLLHGMPKRMAKASVEKENQVQTLESL